MQELLFERIRNILILNQVTWIEKRMMGGTTFMIDDKMCFGTYKGGLLCRIDPLEKDKLLEETEAETITQRGREMKSYVHVQAEGYDSDQDLEFWISKCLEFNPKAKASKKKKSK